MRCIHIDLYAKHDFYGTIISFGPWNPFSKRDLAIRCQAKRRYLNRMHIELSDKMERAIGIMKFYRCSFYV